jgi:hypothetical protein
MPCWLVRFMDFASIHFRLDLLDHRVQRAVTAMEIVAKTIQIIQVS